MTLSGFGRLVVDAAKRWTRRGPPSVADARPVESEVAPGISAPPRSPEVDATVVPASAPQPCADAVDPTAGRRWRSAEAAEAVEAFVAEVRHLPLFSGTATQLIRSIDREDVAGRELTRLVSADASLVAHLLRIVNSPYYGLAHRVATVGDALAVLGVDQVRRTVTAAVLRRPLMSYLHDTEAVHAFWRHELMCAALARHLALQSGLDGEVAYMAGLMHDVGRLAMLMQFPQHLDILLPLVRGDETSGIDRELAQFGFDHAHAGSALLERWGLPPHIVTAAQQHVDDHEPDDAMSASVWRANRLSHAALDPVSDDGEEPAWMREIRLSGAEYRRMLDEIRALESDPG